MVYTKLFFGVVFLYLIGAVFSVVLSRRGRVCIYASFISPLVASLLGIVFSFSVIFGDNLVIGLPDSTPLNFGFFVDGLSAFFMLIISVAVFAVSIYSIGYVQEYEGKRNLGYLGFLYNTFILSMILVVSANNAVMFLIVWELMSIVSYFLVIYEHEKAETRRAGFIYIVMTHVGTGFIMISFLILASSSGSFSFQAFHSTGSGLPPLLRDMAFLCALIGFGTKAGVVPLHIWLPYAHPAAPSNISALMSGIMIKTAIYMLIRVFFDFLGADVMWWGIIILILGSMSAVFGILYAVVESDIKKMLAFSSIENVGIILMGVGVSMIFMASGQAELAAFGLIAGLYHTINHAMFKSLLFMGAGSVIYSTHTRNIEDLGGLIKKMPYTALFFLVGSVSISALPPFNGFVSEWLTFQTQLLSISLSDEIITILVLLSGAGLGLVSALAAVCFVKAFGVGFLALPRSDHAANAKEVPVSMLLGMGMLSLMCVVLGIVPSYFVSMLDLISAPLAGASIVSQITYSLSVETLSPFAGSISPAVIILLMLVFLTLPVSMLMLGRFHYTGYETWGCGQPFSTPRNEYTATAFSKPIRMWLSNVYRSEKEIHTTYYTSPFFRESLRFESQIYPLFERYLYEPVVETVLRISRVVKVIQMGSIHAYLAYILFTLVVLLMFVLWGGDLK